MWMLFTDFCQRCNDESIPEPRRICNFDRLDCNAFCNGSSNDRRMPTFRNLSRGAHARYAVTPPPPSMSVDTMSVEHSTKPEIQQPEIQPEQPSFSGFRFSAVVSPADVLVSTRTTQGEGVDYLGACLSKIDPATELFAPTKSIEQSTVGFKDCLGDHFPDFHSISTTDTLMSRAFAPCELPLGPAFESELDVNLNPFLPPHSSEYEMLQVKGWGSLGWGSLGRKSPTFFAATKPTLIPGFTACAKSVVHMPLVLARK